MLLYKNAALLLLTTFPSHFTADAFAPVAPMAPMAPVAPAPLKRSEILNSSPVGSLTVPNIGCGTIAWSTDKGEKPMANNIRIIV